MPKGAYDRSASAWRPPPRKEYAPELVERVRELYEAGASMREVADACGTTQKVLQTLMPRYGITRRPAVKRNQRGAANHMWRGDVAGYKALHLRVVTARGAPTCCAACDATDPNARYEWANLSGHYELLNDYVRLCLSCHRRLDARRRRGR